MIKLDPTLAAKQNLKNISNTEHNFIVGLRNALFDIGQLAAFEANLLINNDGRTGRVYFIGGVAHQASAPGEAPANITDRLKNSMDYSVHSIDEVEWGSTINYGKWLELGTRKMEPRPFLAVVHKEIGGTAETYLGGRVDDALKRRS